MATWGPAIGGTGSGAGFLAPLPEQGDRLVAGLAQRGGKGQLVLIAAGGLADGRDDEVLVDVVAGSGGEGLEYLPASASACTDRAVRTG